MDLRTVAKLMGHRDIKMTMRYAHLAPDHLQAAVDALEVRLTKTQGKQGGFGVAKVSIDSYRLVQPDIR